MVIDYRRLNAVTVDDKYHYPIPRILDNLGSSTYFLPLNVAQSFQQIEILPKSAKKLHSHYEYICMPFGLKNTPTTFHRVMYASFKNFISLQNHILHLKQIYNNSKSTTLKFN